MLKRERDLVVAMMLTLNSSEWWVTAGRLVAPRGIRAAPGGG
jgi:hypothetical protein